MSEAPPPAALAIPPPAVSIDVTRPANHRIRPLAALSTSNPCPLNTDTNAPLPPATPLTSRSTIFCPLPARSFDDLGSPLSPTTPVSPNVPFPASVTRLRTIAVTLMALMFLAASAQNVYRYINQTPLIKHTIRTTQLQIPNIIFCLNPEQYGNPIATSFINGDAEPTCFGDIALQTSDEIGVVNLTQYVQPVTLPSEAQFLTWRLPDNASVICHRFSSPNLQFTAYSKEAYSASENSVSVVTCGYDYRPSERTNANGRDWERRNDRLHTAIFTAGSDVTRLSKLPAEVVCNTTLDVYLTYENTKALKGDMQTKIRWALGQSIVWYYSQSLATYVDPHRLATGRNYSAYIRISAINELEDINEPNVYMVSVKEEVPSLSPIDIFVTVGGVLSFLTTVFLFLFGSRRLTPFGFVHAIFSRQMKKYLRTKYGDFTSLADVAVPKPKRPKRRKQRRSPKSPEKSMDVYSGSSNDAKKAAGEKGFPLTSPVASLDKNGEKEHSPLRYPFPAETPQGSPTTPATPIPAITRNDPSPTSPIGFSTLPSPTTSNLQHHQHFLDLARQRRWVEEQRRVGGSSAWTAAATPTSAVGDPRIFLSSPAEQRHLRALENFLSEFFVDTDIAVPIVGKLTRRKGKTGGDVAGDGSGKDPENNV
ncbi:uncharacterized protein EV422DRAFT_505772 [Fimicolochytrium jonesii]|uniref:uncharacterized protein n=1 Tax=Fimicolochytrium jonesii TaxID=1396493 RepID=UPI0022FEF0DB|nr:uncharacterized protein EV422DRAFT_505772 [Fimicolochytrium jonesii]KAI8821645.1 hypothetical protein EV422DRAFT_505772 [Fimicolochytrium jonesii]